MLNGLIETSANNIGNVLKLLTKDITMNEKLR